jgi:hypothetical protein
VQATPLMPIATGRRPARPCAHMRCPCAFVQSYATMQRKKADLSKLVSQKVFDVSMDAQEGALYSVLDEMSDQYIKEQLLAYFLLLKNKYPATEARACPRARARACLPSDVHGTGCYIPLRPRRFVHGGARHLGAQCRT